jgi:hypothetical protein
VEFDTRLAASTDQMKRDLLALEEEDRMVLPPIPGSLSKQAEQYVSDHGGYLTYAALNSAGAHPGLPCAQLARLGHHGCGDAMAAGTTC